MVNQGCPKGLPRSLQTCQGGYTTVGQLEVLKISQPFAGWTPLEDGGLIILDTFLFSDAHGVHGAFGCATLVGPALYAAADPGPVSAFRWLAEPIYGPDKPWS